MRKKNYNNWKEAHFLMEEIRNVTTEVFKLKF